MDKELQDAILKSIQTEGASAEENKVIKVLIGSRANLQHIVNLAGGLPRIKPSIISKFQLILSQPETLAALSPLAIRCALCSRVISYPAWYYAVQYAVNHFHYFVCFDANSTNQPTTRCYRRML